MTRVLVTGASGFVGRPALESLRARGWDDIHACSSVPRPGGDGVAWHVADLLDHDAMRRLIADVQPTHLLHLAWYAEPGKFWRASQNLNWLEASVALLRAFRAGGGHRVVMIGTCAEYDWADGVCTEGETPCRPASLYGVCKLALQQVLESFAVQDGFSAAWARLFFMYGPGEHAARLVPSVVRALLRGDDANCSPGTQRRDFMHVADVADALCALLGSEVEGAVNVASGTARAVRDLVGSIARQLDAASRVRLGALPAVDEAPLVVADVRRLQREVGWRPRIEFDDGIAQTIDWWRGEERERVA